MEIIIKGAKENNLKNVDINIGDGLTVVTGVSGSGKSSLVYDTLYHEARRRFMEIFTPRTSRFRLPKAKVDSIGGVSPAVAIDQNVLNRNPLSTLATAAGLHPFLRILYANFGVRFCPKCNSALEVHSEDAIIDIIKQKLQKNNLGISAPIAQRAKGSHRSLLQMLSEQFDLEAILVDGNLWDGKGLNATEEHTIEIKLAELSARVPTKEIREIVQQVYELGSLAVNIRTSEELITLTKVRMCTNCEYWFTELEPKYF
ncbi:MAG: hypothetical protein ACFFBD_11290, partial [Candidatus Hodarchaeota archaeon]